MKKGIVFENTQYKSEWIEKVPGTDYPYRMGTLSQTDIDENVYAVYDGATNYMGFVRTDGSYKVTGDPDPTGYKESFLVEAAKIIQNL